MPVEFWMVLSVGLVSIMLHICMAYLNEKEWGKHWKWAYKDQERLNKELWGFINEVGAQLAKNSSIPKSKIEKICVGCDKPSAPGEDLCVACENGL